jgi:hypothetical protein
MKAEAEIQGHRLVFRTWTYGEKQAVLRRVTKWVFDPAGGGIKPEIDPWDLNDQMLLATLIEWDLKDEEGQPLPITLENLHRIEPPALVEQMIAFAQRLNGVSEEDRKKS